MRIRGIVAGLLLAGLATAASHDKAFWRGVAEKDFAVPEGESLPALVAELSAALASPDPEWRDEIAYTTLTSWIYRQRRLAPAELEALLTEWTASLKAGIGEKDSDSVFRRSFSALALSTLAALDNEQSFLSAARFDALAGSALDYLAAERDLRGYDPSKGWIHATAHTADVLKFLGRSPKLKPARQAAIAAAVKTRLATAGGVFTHGEEERLARALLSLLRRPDVHPALLDAWLSALPAEAKVVWEKPPLDPARYASLQNQRACLRSLYLLTMADKVGRVPETLRAKILEAVLRTG